MDTLINLQEDRFKTLNKSEINYKKSPKERIDQIYIETRLETLEELWKEFKETHRKIIATHKPEQRETLSYLKHEHFEKFEESYTSYKCLLKKSLSFYIKEKPILHQDVGLNNSVVSQQIKLPQIQLPTFCGKYTEWPSYFDLFTAIIDKNDSLSPAQKLHYLKSTLSGEAECLIKNLQTTDNNYESAWAKLISRYNNKRYNSKNILKILFSQKSINQESAANIKQLLDTTSSCLISLDNIGISTQSWDAVIEFLVTSKLDKESHRLWEMHLNSQNADSLSTWRELSEFLESRFRTLEMIDSGNTIQRVSQVPNKVISKPKVFHTNLNEYKSERAKFTIANKHCPMCGANHLLYHCSQFGQQSQKARNEFALSKHLCFNCLAPSHHVNQCRQKTSCRRCGRRHHSLLHYEREENRDHGNNSESITVGEPMPSTSGLNSGSNEINIMANFAKEETESVLLATAVVRAQSHSGQSYNLRALVDQGSQASFVTEEAVQFLGLKRSPINGSVSGLGDGQVRLKYKVLFTVHSHTDPQCSINITAFVLTSLTSLIPSSQVLSPDWPEIDNLPLADAGYASPGKIDILLGAEVYADILLGDLVKHPQGHLMAQNTIFGWVISGKVSSMTTARRMYSLHTQVREDGILRKFWEMENEPNMIQKRLTKSEELCEEFYDLTTVRDKEGRYVVKLPFNSVDPECQYGNSKDLAQKRFYLLEQKFKKNPEFHEAYTRVMKEYLNLNHMKNINFQEQQKSIDHSKAVYIPHHAVIRDDKQTSKLRVVYDASCKGVNGVSLNDNLHVGPKLQQDLRHILMRWRKHSICIVADIIKMYRQVRVHPEDTRFQRILWRENPSEPVRHYELLTVTFGMACAPYLAIKSLQRLAEDEQSNFPIASKITKQDFYVDDLMTTCETDAEAMEIYKQMNQLLNSGGFCLQKWNSNSNNFMNFINNTEKSSEKILDIKTDNMVKVLGIQWNRDTDNFQYTVHLSELHPPITKRKVLSDIARQYDPMGWIAPVIVTAKIFMQRLWKSGLPWDGELTGVLLEEWLKYREELNTLKEIIVPRWLHYSKGSQTELHAFSDASQSAYGAAVYLKVIDAQGSINVHLISAKTKVAPIEKELSIPRLELCGAVLATKLLFEVSQIMDIQKEHLYAWTDSTVVLAWLHGLPSRWTTFVSNRVSEILNILDYHQFRHISTKDNPADLASRGVPASQLKNQAIWWHGPKILQEKYLPLPEIHFKTNEEEKLSERKSFKSLVTLKEEKIKILLEQEEKLIWAKYSSLQKMLRVLSYIRRFLIVKDEKTEVKVKSKFITFQETQKCLLLCVRQVQELWFNCELMQLKSRDNLPKGSELHSLRPFICDEGILRVGGRIHMAKASYNERHPIILPEMSHLTQAIITDAHNITLHGGPQAMLNYIRSQFWIIRARKQVKRHYRRCITCLRFSQRKNTPLMGQLPEVRLQPGKPFKTAGVDYAGPINVRFSPGRGAKSYKGYICLFICMVTRAIHLEVVSDLTTKGFIAAFRRFVGRRGRCEHLYSDNGTNFVGANKELREMFNSEKSNMPEEIAELLTTYGTTWHYIPPHAPNFGGLWEAAVRSTKLHLCKIIGDSTLTYEEFSTLLIQIEACLNSRPISLLSDHPDDPLPLTPGHFLVGEPLVSIADGIRLEEEGKFSNLERWRLIQRMTHQFWKKWAKEYLLNLDKHYKWTTKICEPNIGDIVIIQEDNLPPTKWILGKVIQKHMGKDNITRVVTVKCKDKLLKRPINKLCFLPKE